MPVQTNCSQHFIQKLTGAANKGLAVLVFVAARRFPDNHHLRLRVSVTKHQIARPAPQITMLKAGQCGLQSVKRAGGFGHLFGNWNRILLGNGLRRRLGSCGFGSGRFWRCSLKRKAVHRRIQDCLGCAQFHLPFQQRACAVPVYLRFHKRNSSLCSPKGKVFQSRCKKVRADFISPLRCNICH